MNLKKNAVLIGTVAGMSLFTCSPILAAASESPFDSERLSVVLKAANILKPDSKLLNVYATGQRVTAMIQRNEIADDQTSKIDAMFVARTLFNAFPSEIGDVRVLFSTAQGHEGKVVNITANLVSDFSAGKISPKALISNLQVEDIQSEAAPNVMQGPSEDRRLLIWHRIKVLQDGGTGVKPFLSLFQDMETKVKDGNKNEISMAAENLEEKLSAQEEQVKLAHKAAAGRGILVTSRTSDLSGKPPGADKDSKPKVSATIVEGGSVNGGAKFGSNTTPTTIGGLPVAEFRDSGAETFMEKACQELEQRKDPDAQRYRDRKNRIEETYKFLDKNKAQADLADFKIEFSRKVGIQPPSKVVLPTTPLWGQSR